MMEVFLYNSTVCRLCGEENDNGTLLYSCEENTQNLGELINTYLPLKVSDDGQLPRTICPGCTIQLEATVEFFTLIYNGQKVIRELYQREKEYKSNNEISTMTEENVLTDTMVYEITTDGVYQEEHPAALAAAGLDKPKRKRGRPPKKTKANMEKAQAQDTALKQAELPKTEAVETTGKRRRKTPTRYKEAVQGKELERIFKEEGVIDGDEDEENKAEAERKRLPREPEVIGHREDSGELVVVVKGKGRGRPKGRSRQGPQECDICGLQFSCVGRYMSHVASHGPVRYRCRECGATLPTRLQFEQHQARAGHTGRLVLPADADEETTCRRKTLDAGRYQLPTRLQFEQHQARAGHTGRLVLPADADEEFPTHAEVLIEAPKDPLAPDVETSNVCEGLPDLSAEPPEPPQPAQTTEQATSDVNNDVMPDTTGDDNALTMNLPNDPEDEEKTKKGKPKLKCNHCDKMFSSKQSKSMHIKATHQGERPYTCGECGAKFAYPRSLSLHAVSHRRGKHAKGYACDLCGKVLNHPSSVVYHKEAEHAGQRYICSKCGKHFKHKQLLARHQLVHSQHRPFTCKTCNASFKTKANLLNHALLHSGVKRFSCEICKHKFAHKTSLTLHMRWHTGQKPYSCGSCGKSFSQKGNLSEHERIHTGEKPYGCTLCGRRFTTSSQHRLHARRHAAERPFACNQCGKRSHECVVAHERIHTGEKPYGCTLCGRRFTTSSQHRLHARRHAAERPFACNQCGKRFLSRAAYAAHARREAGARAHRCGWCGRGFAERWALLKHARRHTGERPFRCPHCPRTFADCSNMNKHRKQVHKQISLLAPEPERSAPVAMVAEPSPEPALDNAGDSDSERVIYVAYDVGSDEPAYHIIDAEQALELQEPEEEPEISQPEPTQHMPVTDEHGNPLHFTMQDGTRLAITSADGHSLQVVTRDGQTIPVEINGYAEPEEVDNPDTIVHQLHLQKSVDGAGHLYALV